MEPSVLWLLLQEGEVHLRARPMDLEKLEEALDQACDQFLEQFAKKICTHFSQICTHVEQISTHFA